MAKKQQQSIELDYEQKRMANLFGKNLTEADGVRRFLAEGCRAANKDGGVSDAEFWEGLFLESKVKGKYGKNLLGKTSMTAIRMKYRLTRIPRLITNVH